MKNIPYLLIVLLFTACSKDYLDTAPYGQSTSDQFWRNADDAVAAANALYEPLDDEDFFGHTEQTFEICSDDFWRAGDHGEDQAIEDFTFDPSNAQLRFSYTRKYEIINRANAILINVPDIDMDATLRNRVLGEAHFMRAFAMWRQHVIYGSLPIISEDDFRDNDFNKPKATIEEFRAFMEDDWKQAAELLPATHTPENIGRPTSGTANGFLAKLYVHWEKFNEAIAAGEKVINGPYPLADNFADNFHIDTENNPEMLFAVQCLEGWNGCDYRIYTTPRPWGGWDFHEPIQDLIDEYEANDPRLDATVFKLGDMVDLGGDRGVTEYVEGLSQTNYHFRKFASWRSSGGLSDDQNVPILRSADVYLLVAEAKIRSGQNGDAELNAVRQRAGLTPKTNATMADVIHERRVELAGENQRHLDLVRWDQAGIIDIVAHYQIDRGQFKPSRNFQRPKHYYFAIPQREIDLSNGVLEQNTGY
ncbi:MAG: RagB/SusD family nutrient uptake outer membrane protein [Saprospiraceae bacterium]|nr:RagB/SusD family nutrient uptake outer membrane protein [Lewinella sp.]